MIADLPSPVLHLAIAAQVVYCMVGLALWILFMFRPPGRNQLAPLGPWLVLPSDLLACALFVVGGAVFSQFFVSLVVQWLFHRPAPGTDAATLVYGLAMHVGAIAGAFGAWIYLQLQEGLASRLRTLDGTALPVDLPPRAPSLPWPLSGVLTFCAALPVTLLASGTFYLVSRFLHLRLEPQEALGILLRLKSPTLMVLFFVLATVLAPVAEELVFRAGLFRYLRTRVPRWVALLLPAVVFAAAHCNLASFLPLAALAVVFSLAYERTGRIGVTMVAHGLFNLNMILLVLAGLST